MEWAQTFSGFGVGLLISLAGVIRGILVPISPIGAGALGAAILLFLYPSLPIKRIVGTDLAYTVPLTAIDGLGHLQMGNVDPTLLATLLHGSPPDIYLGSHMYGHPGTCYVHHPGQVC